MASEVLLCERESFLSPGEVGGQGHSSVIPVGGGASSVPLRLNSSGEQKY